MNVDATDTLERRFPPKLSAVAAVRQSVAQWLRYHAISGEDAQDLIVVASELATNALRAADSHLITLRCALEGSDVRLEIENPGPANELAHLSFDTIPDVHKERGRGLYVVAALTDELHFEILDDRTVAQCRKRVQIGANTQPSKDQSRSGRLRRLRRRSR